MVTSAEEAVARAEKIGFPIMVKASEGDKFWADSFLCRGQDKTFLRSPMLSIECYWIIYWYCRFTSTITYNNSSILVFWCILLMAKHRYVVYTCSLRKPWFDILWAITCRRRRKGHSKSHQYGGAADEQNLLFSDWANKNIWPSSWVVARFIFYSGFWMKTLRW